jgi:phospholipid/cholesterol/gamma-HCH transport system permease protein
MIIVLPLLTLISMIAGIFGSMVTAYFSLGIDFSHFLAKFYDSVSVNHYIVGMVKSPVFALVITLVGCFQGLIVEKSTVSVSNNTTKSVVQALFLIIIVDAIFSIFLAGIK